MNESGRVALGSALMAALQGGRDLSGATAAGGGLFADGGSAAADRGDSESTERFTDLLQRVAAAESEVASDGPVLAGNSAELDARQAVDPGQAVDSAQAAAASAAGPAPEALIALLSDAGLLAEAERIDVAAARSTGGPVPTQLPGSVVTRLQVHLTEIQQAEASVVPPALQTSAQRLLLAMDDLREGVADPRIAELQEALLPLREGLLTLSAPAADTGRPDPQLVSAGEDPGRTTEMQELAALLYGALSGLREDPSTPDLPGDRGSPLGSGAAQGREIAAGGAEQWPAESAVGDALQLAIAKLEGLIDARRGDLASDRGDTGETRALMTATALEDLLPLLELLAAGGSEQGLAGERSARALSEGRSALRTLQGETGRLAVSADSELSTAPLEKLLLEIRRLVAESTTSQPQGSSPEARPAALASLLAQQSPQAVLAETDRAAPATGETLQSRIAGATAARGIAGDGVASPGSVPLNPGADSRTAPGDDIVAAPGPAAASFGPAWARESAETLLREYSQGQRQVELPLGPRGPGSLALEFTAREEGLHIQVRAQQGASRAALEEALPRLREALGEQGLKIDSMVIARESPGPAPRLRPVATMESLGARVEVGTGNAVPGVSAAAGSEGGNMAATSAQAVTTAVPAAATSSATSLEQPLRPSEPGWSQAFATRVLWQLDRGLERAEIQLEPPELGRLAIRVEMDGDRLNLQVQAQNAVAREALESALPRLRELLAEQGLSLGDADISSGGEEHSASGTGREGTSADNVEVAEAEDSAQGGDRSQGAPDRLYDGYA